MQMSETTVVIEAHGSTDANRMLEQGWKLLAVVPGTTGAVVYVLGKPKEKESSLGVLRPRHEEPRR